MITTVSHEHKASPDSNSTQYLKQETNVNSTLHITPGRLRIRLGHGNWDQQLERIRQHLQQQDGVREVVINQQIGSLVITFDENQFPCPEMLATLQQLGIQEPQNPPDLTNQTDLLSEWKSWDFWKNQSIALIPLLTGLGVTGGLGIKGLAAIPLYILTADTTRWVMNYLEPSATQSAPTPPAAKIAYRVVHQIPGRIRFYVPQITNDRAYGRRLERLLKTDKNVTHVRVNSDAASVAVAYKSESKEISISHWVELMELALQTNPPSQPLNTNTTIESEDQTQIVNSLWTDMKPTSLCYSLAFLANFPL